MIDQVAVSAPSQLLQGGMRARHDRLYDCPLGFLLGVTLVALQAEGQEDLLAWQSRLSTSTESVRTAHPCQGESTESFKAGCFGNVELGTSGGSRSLGGGFGHFGVGGGGQGRTARFGQFTNFHNGSSAGKGNVASAASPLDVSSGDLRSSSGPASLPDSPQTSPGGRPPSRLAQGLGSCIAEPSASQRFPTISIPSPPNSPDFALRVNEVSASTPWPTCESLLTMVTAWQSVMSSVLLRTCNPPSSTPHIPLSPAL